MDQLTGHAIGLVSVSGEKNGSRKFLDSPLSDAGRVNCIIIPHSRPTIDENDIIAVTKVLASGMIAQGEKVRKFEDAVSRFVGTKYAVAVSSGTSALHLALLGLGVGPMDEVLMPSYVCSSPYFAATQTGGVPKIVDIDLKDLNIDAEAAKCLVCSRTKALVVPHMFGNPAQVEELLALGVPLIEDCAQSLGAKYHKREVGSFGEASVFSFYATKMITTGEGGMILTDQREIFERVQDLRDYDKKPLKPAKYNYKMTDFQAALGLSQLEKLQKFIERREKIASIYSESFSDCKCEIPDMNPENSSAFYRYVVMLDRLTTVQKKLKQNGVMCERPVNMPLHKHFSSFECPHSERAFERALSIPIYPSLTEDEIEFVAVSLRQALRNHKLT
jgi:dTDP-4-amino-4,6-dideoxygalactose transaminase